jgi:hypothetical protein
VPVRGFEPLRPCGLRILSPNCLPVPAHRHVRPLSARAWESHYTARGRPPARTAAWPRGWSIARSTENDSCFAWRSLHNARRLPPLVLVIEPRTLSGRKAAARTQFTNAGHGPLRGGPGVGHRHLPGDDSIPAAPSERSDHFLSERSADVLSTTRQRLDLDTREAAPVP